MPTITPPPLDNHLLTLINLALQEDLAGPGGGALTDQTVEIAIPPATQATGTIVARKPGTLAGSFLLPAILDRYLPFGHASITLLTPDASRLSPNQPIAKITGAARTILAAERTLLNFLGHLSGIATLTATYVDTIADIHSTTAGTPPQIVDTRKTTPGFRALDKYAVRCGGGGYHRMGLYDGVMLKDNHLAALKQKLGHELTLAQLTQNIRAQLPPSILLWLEVDTLDQFQQSLPQAGERGADIILLDNFTPAQMKQAVALRNQMNNEQSAMNNRIPLLEASGGITLANLREVAATGIDRIAIGALTHSAPVLDVSMDFE